MTTLEDQKPKIVKFFTLSNHMIINRLIILT